MKICLLVFFDAPVGSVSPILQVTTTNRNNFVIWTNRKVSTMSPSSRSTKKGGFAPVFLSLYRVEANLQMKESD